MGNSSFVAGGTAAELQAWKLPHGSRTTSTFRGLLFFSKETRVCVCTLFVAHSGLCWVIVFIAVDRVSFLFPLPRLKCEELLRFSTGKKERVVRKGL